MGKAKKYSKSRYTARFFNKKIARPNIDTATFRKVIKYILTRMQPPRQRVLIELCKKDYSAFLKQRITMKHGLSFTFCDLLQHLFHHPQKQWTDHDILKYLKSKDELLAANQQNQQNGPVV